jgi:ankyrin repeat protein
VLRIRNTSLEDLTKIVLEEDYDHVWDILLSNRAFDQTDSTGWTPLHAAALLDAHFLIEPLVAAGCSPIKFNQLGDAPIHIAAARNSTKFLRRMLEPTSINVRKNNDFESVALHSAVTYGSVEAVRILLDAGVDPNIRDFYGITPMHYAVVHQDQIGMVELLAESGTVIDDAQTDLGSPLHCAVEGRRFGAAITLIELGADTTRATSDGLSFAGLVNAVGWSGLIDYEVNLGNVQNTYLKT